MKKFIISIAAVTVSLTLMTGCTMLQEHKNIDTNDFKVQLKTLEKSATSNTDLPVKDGVTDPATGWNGTPTEAGVVSDEFKVYYQLLNEINKSFEQEFYALKVKLNEDINAAKTSILGVEFADLLDEQKTLKEEYNILVDEFYSNEDYITLREELNALIEELNGLSGQDTEAKLAEVKAKWTEISVLADVVNDRIAEINTRIRELNKLVVEMERNNQQAILNAVTPIMKDYNNAIKAVNDRLNAEIDLLNKTFGFDYEVYPNGSGQNKPDENGNYYGGNTTQDDYNQNGYCGTTNGTNYGGCGNNQSGSRGGCGRY